MRITEVVDDPAVCLQVGVRAFLLVKWIACDYVFVVFFVIAPIAVGALVSSVPPLTGIHDRPHLPLFR